MAETLIGRNLGTVFTVVLREVLADGNGASERRLTQVINQPERRKHEHDVPAGNKQSPKGGKERRLPSPPQIGTLMRLKAGSVRRVTEKL